MTDVLTKIDNDISHYLCIVERCPVCGGQTALTFDSLVTPNPPLECGHKSSYSLGSDILSPVWAEFDGLRRQLQIAGCDLYFVHKTHSNLESEADKP